MFKVPVKHDHKYRNLALEFSGAGNSLSDKTILLLHDRRNVMELKHFMSENASVSGRPMKEIRKKEDEGVVTISDFSWSEPQSMRQVQEALENYKTLLHLLWPMDQSGNIIGRLLLKYWYISAATDPRVRISVICSYFNAIQRLNAKRAANKSTVLNYEEHEKMLKETLASHGLRSEVPYDGAGRAVDRQEATAASGARLVRTQNKQPRITLVNGLKVCYDFNNSKCTRKPNQMGCEDAKGDKFAHNCNVYIREKNMHCHAKHPRTAHKF